MSVYSLSNIHTGATNKEVKCFQILNGLLLLSKHVFVRVSSVVIIDSLRLSTATLENG